MARAKAVPEWLVTKAGKIDTVPKPWGPVRVKGDTVACWGREHRFDGCPLPAQIVSCEAPLLARPISVHLNADGVQQAWRRCTVESMDRHPNGRHATRTAVGRVGNIMIKSVVTVHFDGAMRLDVELDPLHPVDLAGLTIEIPIRRREAAYVSGPFLSGTSGGVNCLAADKLPADEVAGGFHRPLAWIGNEERGLGWCASSEEGWDKGDCLAVRRERNALVFQMRVVRTPRRLDAPLSISFGLQANPWRPLEKGSEHFNIYHHHWLYGFDEEGLRALRDLGVTVLIFHSLWSHHHSYPETRYSKQLHTLVRRAHKLGMKLLVYFGSEFSHGAPEWPDWGERWARRDPEQGYRPTREPRYPAPHICTNTEWPDYILHGIERLLEKYDLDGVYLDGWADWTGPCSKAIHGCGYDGPDGTRQPTYPFWTRRDLMERVYNLVKTHRPDGLVDLHASPGPAIMTAHFGTSCFGGEGYQGDFGRVNLGQFRALHMGREQWGVHSDIIASADVDYGMTMGVVHNVLPRAGAYEPGHRVTLRQQARVWRARDAFGAWRADWLPYWRNQDVVRVRPEGVKVSLWARPGKGALFAISNLGHEDARANVHVRWNKIGLEGDREPLDLLSEELPLRVRGSGMDVSVPAHRYRLVFVGGPQDRLWKRMEKCRRWISEQADQYTRLDEWMVLGPFGEAEPAMVRDDRGRVRDVGDDYRGLETPFPPELGPVDLSAKYVVADGREQGWIRAMAEDGFLTIPHEAMRGVFDVIYLYTRVFFPTLVPSHQDNPVDILLRTSHATRMWVNGEEVYKHGGTGTPRYGIRPSPSVLQDPDVIPAVLHPGWNPVLIKTVARQTPGTRISFEVTGRGGAKIPPLQIEAIPK